MQPDMPQDDGFHSAPRGADDGRGDERRSSGRTRAVAAAADRRILQEALRQLESIDFDDPDWRVEPLSAFPVGVSKPDPDETVDCDVDC